MSEIENKYDINEIESYIAHLKLIRDFDIFLENDEKFHKFLFDCIQNSYENEFIQLIAKTKIYEFFPSLLQYFCSIRSSIDFSCCSRPIYSFCSDFNHSEKILYYLKNLNTLINLTFLNSTDARSYFNGTIENLQTFMIFISDIEFISSFINYDSLFDGFINTLYFLSESSNEYKHNWQSLDSTSIVLNFARSIPKWNFVAYAIISLIASDKEMEKMDELDEILSKFIPLTIQCISEHECLIAKQFHDLSEKVNINIRSISGGNGFLYLIDYYLNTLYGFGINNKLKEKIYFYENFAKSIKFLIYDGNEVEKFYAIKLLTQLSFNDIIKKELATDIELLDFIKEITNLQSFEFQKLKIISSDFIWILSKSEPQLEAKIGQNEDHIMISYNTNSRETCLKIKKELEHTGYKIWIDINEIHGSSLDSMAKAIENSSIVLMCVSEKYRQSINCQAEAQYAFRLSKTIIPLIMQPGYHNVSGWLGLIIGDKIFVDFTKYKFEESINRLKNQISLCLNKVQSLTVQTKAVFKNDSNGPKDWKEDQVKNWFNEHGIVDLYDILKPLNGGILFQIYELKVFSPEFFYKSLTSKECVDIKMISVFAYELIKLFGDT